jgi:hypothetical protein
MPLTISPLKIRLGAASMSYDLTRGHYTIATVWSGTKVPDAATAHRNALIIAHAFDMRDALRAAIDRLEYIGDESDVIAPLRRALPRMPEGEF